MSKATPFFMFTNCKAEEAIERYQAAFKDVQVEEVMRWPEGVPMGPAGKIQSALLTLNGTTFRFMDSEGHQHSLTPSTSIFVEFDNEAELRTAYERLIDGGFELMPLSTDYPFAKLFAWIQDPFGLTWQLSYH